MTSNNLSKLENFYSIYKSLLGENILSFFPENEKLKINRNSEKINKLVSNFRFEREQIAKDELPLYLGFVGGFNSGKSSIINSILGEELLGIGITPTTKKITIMKYGDELRLKVIKKDETTEDINKDKYEYLATHKGDDTLDNKSKNFLNEIDRFEIYYNNDILRDINIVDTPGFFSINEGDDTITKEWLDKLDVILWIFDVSNRKEIGADEIEELERIKKTNKDKKIIAVLNKIETKTENKKKEYKEDFEKYPYFEKTIIYSAKKILSNKKKNRHNEGIFNSLCENIKLEYDKLNNQKIIIELSKQKASLTRHVVINNYNTNDVFFDEKILRYRNKKTKKLVKSYNDLSNIIKEFELQKIRNISFDSNYKELIEILNDIHRNIKKEKERTFNINLEKEISIYQYKLTDIKDNLSKKKKFLSEDLDKIKQIIKNFRNDFKIKIEEYRKNFKVQLFGRLTRLFKGTDNKSKIKEEIKKRFKNFYKEQTKEFKNFIMEQEFLKYDGTLSKDEIDYLSYWLKELTDASSKSIDGIWKLREKYVGNIDSKELEEIIDLIIPDEQLYNILVKTINSRIKTLLERIIKEKKRELDNIEEIIRWIEKELRMDTQNSKKEKINEILETNKKKGEEKTKRKNYIYI